MKSIIIAVDLSPLSINDEFYYSLLTKDNAEGYTNTTSIDTAIQLVTLSSQEEREMPGFDEYVYSSITDKVYSGIKRGDISDEPHGIEMLWAFYDDLYSDTMELINGISSLYLQEEISEAHIYRHLLGDVHYFKVR